MTAPHVIVVGSINADLTVTAPRLPAPGETVTGGRFARHGGGKGANQAVAAARMGAAVALVGAIGADELGDEALRELRAEGVDVASVARREGEATGVAAIVVDEAMGENQIAVASGANATLGGGDVRRSLASLLDRSAQHAGVVLLGHEIPEEALIAAARAAREAGWTIVLNPAPARPLAREILDAGPILTPNAPEARELTGLAQSDEAAAALARSTGAPVIVTLGAEGALLVERGGPAQRLLAQRVAVTDTTGAGDALTGTLAAELARGRDVRGSLRVAVASAALAVQVPGARAGLARRQEVLRFLRSSR
jgi:ribokinase